MIIINKLDSLEDIANSAAEQLITLARESISWRGEFSVALAGGSTPQPLYQKLARQGRDGRVSWDKVHFFWGDERMVPPDHDQSNYRLAKKNLLDPLEINSENIHRIKGELPPEQAAAHYQDKLMTFFSSDIPRFDLILLGMGADGHTASLFPQTKALKKDAPEQLVVANFVPALGSWRVTFTPLLINAAANVSFLVAGQKKKHRVNQVLTGRYQPQVLPAQIIKPTQGTLTWFLDQEAGKLI